MSVIVGVADPVDNGIEALTANSVVVLDLTGGKSNYIDDEDVQDLMAAFATNTSCTVLDLSLNRISNLGAAKIAKTLREHQSCKLAVLELDSNCIEDEGAEALALALPPSLVKLDLSGNKLTDNGVAKLLQALDGVSTASLKCLLLRNNPSLTDASAESFGRFLVETAQPLQSLHLSGNHFTNDAIPALVAALTMSHTLTDVNLSNTDMTEFEQFAAIFSKNDLLLNLVLGKDGKKVVIPEIEAALKLNRKKAAARRTEIALLRDQHAEEIRKLMLQHKAEVDCLRQEIQQLKEKIPE